MRYGTLLALAACLSLATPVGAAEVLQNDSFSPGDQIAFYPGLGDQAEFTVIVDGPQNIEGEYRICRLFLMIGPGRDFNIFTIRVGAADDEGGEAELIWQSDLDAFQIFASPDQISAVDLALYGLFSDADQLRINFRHVEGSLPQPTIASDTDGITPGRNQVVMFQRNGEWLFANTEDLPDNLRPPGDWLVRAEVVEPDLPCPNVDDPIVGLPDFGPRPDAAPPRDMGVRDAAPPPRDAAPPRDMAVRDAAPPRDMAVRLDQAVDAGFDFGSRPRDLEVTGVTPSAGPNNTNTDVVITGRGFPFGEAVQVTLGDNRLLEPEVLGGSTIKAIVPAGLDPGLYDLEVTRDDGQAAILPAAYTVLGNGLSLVEVIPNTIIEGATPEISLLGGGFGSDMTARIGGAPLEDLRFDSATTVTGALKVPLTAGTYDVTLKRGDLEFVAPGAFTVKRPGGQVADDCRAAPGRGVGNGLPVIALALLGLLAVRRRR